MLVSKRLSDLKVIYDELNIDPALADDKHFVPERNCRLITALNQRSLRDSRALPGDFTPSDKTGASRYLTFLKLFARLSSHNPLVAYTLGDENHASISIDAVTEYPVPSTLQVRRKTERTGNGSREPSFSDEETDINLICEREPGVDMLRPYRREVGVLAGDRAEYTLADFDGAADDEEEEES